MNTNSFKKIFYNPIKFYLDDKIMYQPALFYVVIALIMLSISILLKLNAIDLAEIFSQIFSIIIFALILIGINDISLEMSWIVSTIIIICTVSMTMVLIINSLFAT